MATTHQEHGLRIGEALKRGRTRLRLDVRTVEERTKIRTKYLRALEAEDWDVLPGPTYVKGFLRVYGQFLGLDAEALVDDYRRRVESALPDGGRYSLTDPVLEHRRRLGDDHGRRRRFATLLVVLALVAAAAVAIVALTGGSSGHSKHHHRARDQRHHHSSRSGAHGAAKNGGGTQTAGTVTLALVAKEDVVVCLVRGSGAAQIDSQALTAGASAGPFQPPADRYRLDLDSGGVVALTLNGRHITIRNKRPASYRITPGGVRPTDFRGPACP